MLSNEVSSYKDKAQGIMYFLCCALFLMSNLNLIKTLFMFTNLSETGVKTLSIAICMLVSIIIIFIFLYRIISTRRYVCLTVWIIINLVYSSPYIIECNLDGLAKYLCFVVPFSCLGLEISADKNGAKLFVNCFLKMNPIGILGAVIYIFYVFLANSNYVGYLSYGDIAYIFLPFLIINAYKIAKNNSNKLMDYISYGVYTAAILYTGTRSALFCIFFLFVGVLIYAMLICKWNFIKMIKSSIMILFIVTIFIGIFAISFTPSASRLSSIKDNVIYENDTKNLIEKQGFQNIQNRFIELIVKEDYPAEEAEALIYDDIRNKTKKYVIISEQNYDEALHFKIEYNRITLWKIAIEEFKTSPVLGGGLHNYENKVGLSAHNVILEAFADFGIIGGVLFIFGVVYLLIYNYTLINKRETEDDFLILLFIGTFIPMYLLFTGLYMNGRLIFSIAFLLMNFIYDLHTRKQTNNL